MYFGDGEAYYQAYDEKNHKVARKKNGGKRKRVVKRKRDDEVNFYSILGALRARSKKLFVGMEKNNVINKNRLDLVITLLSLEIYLLY